MQKDGTITDAKYQLLERFYSNGREPALTFLNELKQLYPDTTLEDITEAAIHLDRNDIVEDDLLKSKNKSLKTISLQELSKLANYLECRGSSITKHWKDFASYFGFGYYQINKIESIRLATDIGGPTEALLKVSVEEKPDLQLDKLIKSLKTMHRIDAVICLEEFSQVSRYFVRISETYILNIVLLSKEISSANLQFLSFLI